MNTFASTTLQGLSPFELVFTRKPRQLTSFELPKLTSFPVEYREFFRLLLLAPYSSSLQSSAQKFRQDYIGSLAIDTKIDDTHYLLKDVTGRMLPGDYHINRIKKAKEVTPDGLADTYKQLQTQIGLPNDACANSQKSSAAQL